MKHNRLNTEVVVLSVVNFLYCFGVYATLPVLALYFNADLGVPVAQIGILLGVPPIIGAVFGSLGVVLAKKVGEVPCLILGLVLMIIPYVGYLFATDYLVLLVMSGLLGLARVVWSPIIKSLFAFHAQKVEAQKLAFQINYITICLGAILGPLITMIPNLPKHINITISICLFAGIILVLLMNRTLLSVQMDGTEEKGARGLLRLAGVDQRLFFYILAGLLVFVVFSQFETVFSLALKGVSQDPERLFSLLLILNAVSGIALQFVIMWLGKKLNTIGMLLGGILAFALAFFVFAESNGSLVLLVSATLLFSVGEVLSIPSGDVVISEIAPPEKRTLYFGLAELRTLGFSLGPVFASFVLDTYGSYLMFLSSTVVMIFAGIMYAAPSVIQKHKRAFSLRGKSEIGRG